MWDKLWINDKFYDKLDELVLGGKFRVGKDGKLILTLAGGAYGSPWIFIRQPGHNCLLWMEYFQSWGLLTDFCAHGCYKVCVYPETVKQLFELHDIMEELDLPSKCGVDVRDYTPGKETNYAAYFYCNSKNEADEVYKKVLDLDLPYQAIIKQGCTEHEIFEKAEPDAELEARLDTIFGLKPEDSDYVQGDWLKNKIKIWWLKYARGINDKTYREVHLLPADERQYKTYQEE